MHQTIKPFTQSPSQQETTRQRFYLSTPRPAHDRHNSTLSAIDIPSDLMPSSAPVFWFSPLPLSSKKATRMVALCSSSSSHSLAADSQPGPERDGHKWATRSFSGYCGRCPVQRDVASASAMATVSDRRRFPASGASLGLPSFWLFLADVHIVALPPSPGAYDAMLGAISRV
jgi:hypothetical protein